MDQVAEIAIDIFEEGKAIALIREWLADEGDTFGLEHGVSRIEIVNGNREVANARGLHFVRAGFSSARDDFEHGTVLRLDEGNINSGAGTGTQTLGLFLGKEAL